ncbi:MAG: hypothetical protein C4539_18800, partial [Ignavibacteriales bacterium]
YHYKSKKVEDVKGLLNKDSVTGWLWIVSALSIIGLPPFPIFISKFFIIKAFWLTGQSWLAIIFFLFIVIITFGMSSTVFNMSFGEQSEEEKNSIKPNVFAYAPQIVLLIILIIIGLNMPTQIYDFINRAAAFFQ